MIEEVEKTMLDNISFQGYQLPINYTVQQFLNDFCNLRNHYYTQNEFGMIVTSIGKYRSLNDIYCITKHYFPEVTLKQIMKILAEQVQTEQTGVLFCADIKKRVFYVPKMLNAGFAQNNDKFYGRYQGTKKGKDEYGFDEHTYLNLLNK